MRKINSILFLFVFILLVYTRFVNIGWGLPYPFHPDERNMAVAVQGLNCRIQNSKFRIQNCLNPHFFAYGQFPLYLGYFGILWTKLILGKLSSPINFEEAILSLRIISAIASIMNAFVLLKIIEILTPKSKIKGPSFLWLLIITFAPFFIQFSHFGTTESLLMLLYSLIIYFSLTAEGFMWLAFVLGLAISTKISSIIFLAVPVMSAVLSSRKNYFRSIAALIIAAGFFSLLFSPHNFISFKEFISSIRYESDVATGRALVFYTRQFIGSIPVIFQVTKIFPYALGWPLLLLATLGFLGISWKKRELNFLRFSLLIYFLPNAFLFAKWTRFMAPIFPIMLLFAVLGLNEFLIFNFKFKIKNLMYVISILIIIIPGIAYLSIYQNQDIRFVASNWIYKNIASSSYILSETGNVVDIPIPISNYHIISFNFYDLDVNADLQTQLKDHVQKANYIFIPSRRIFTNNPSGKFPKLSGYYQKLFAGRLGFKKIEEFNSYPTLKFQISNFKFLLNFPDEQAEETWTVFDHPVIRIYKKV